VHYILSLGFLKTDNYRVLGENAKYEFINEMFQKYFISKYITNTKKLTDFKQYMQKVKDEKEYDVFAFLNLLLMDKKNEYKILVDTFSELFEGINNVEFEIKLLAMTQIRINNFDKKIEQYEKFIYNLKDNIKQKILDNKIKKLRNET
jgi:hypothetical protein